MMICTNCGHTNPEGATHCEACYAELPKMTLCSSCQADVPEDALFCSQCGAQLQPELQMGSDDLAMAPTNVVPPVDPLAPTNVSANDPAMSQVPPTDVMELESRATGQVPATDLDDPYIPPSVVNLVKSHPQHSVHPGH